MQLHKKVLFHGYDHVRGGDGVEEVKSESYAILADHFDMNLFVVHVDKGGSLEVETVDLSADHPCERLRQHPWSLPSPVHDPAAGEGEVAGTVNWPDLTLKRVEK